MFLRKSLEIVSQSAKTDITRGHLNDSFNDIGCWAVPYAVTASEQDGSVESCSFIVVGKYMSACDGQTVQRCQCVKILSGFVSGPMFYSCEDGFYALRIGNTG